MSEILPGAEVHLRGLRWQVVYTQPLGAQTLFRLRGMEGALLGRELDILHPFETILPVVKDFQPERAAPLRRWLAPGIWIRPVLKDPREGTRLYLLGAAPGKAKPMPSTNRV